MMDDIILRDFQPWNCNCNSAMRIQEGKCIFNSKYRIKYVIYKAICLICKRKYIRNTQQHLKTRINQHINNIVKLKNKNIISDSFTQYFIKHFKHDNKIKASDVRNLLDIKVIRKLKPVDVVKTFGSLECKLYIKERIKIIKLKLFCCSLHKYINRNMEIYRAC